MLAGIALLLFALGSADPATISPKLTADLDGDGQAETVTAAAARGAVSVEVRDAAGKKKADAKAPAPAADLVLVALTAAPLPGGGSLVAVSASTDASDCFSVWRYNAGALARIPIRDSAGAALPDCGAPGAWSRRWETEADGKSSALVLERTEKTERGTLRSQDVFLFDGASLRAAPKRAVRELDGIPIPAWYEARLYTRSALDKLYSRFGLADLKSQPEMRIVTDRSRGVFAVHLRTASGEIIAPVEAFAATPGSSTAKLVARAGQKSFRVEIRLAGDGSVPFEVKLDGLGKELDQVYAPAGTWHGQVRQVFLTAADELVSQYLAGTWSAPQGEQVTMGVEGGPPYRIRLEKALLTPDLDGVTAPSELWLLPAEASGRAWGLVLRGPNAVERIPLTCAGEGAARRCQADGAGQTLHRLGARMNVS